MTALRQAARVPLRAISVAEAALVPWLDLTVRLAVAQAAVVAQMVEMMSDTRAGATVSIMSSAGALHDLMVSDVGMVVQALCPVLLALGLLSRVAAAAMLVQAALLPMPGDAGLFWAALLLRVLILGPDALSLDRLLHRGAESLAVPGAAHIRHVFTATRRVLGPIYQLCLRIWLAAAPVGIAFAALAVTPDMRPGLASWLPHVPPMVGALSPWLAPPLAIMLVAGAGTRVGALVLVALVPLSAFVAGDARLYWVLLLAAVVLHGAGPYSVDGWVSSWLVRRGASVDRAGLPHVVIVGGGFGGVAAVRGLRYAECGITLIDQRNYHLFQPLLYQVATASLSPADIATPVRSIFRSQANVRVLLGEVTGVDPATKAVFLDRGAIHYDYLVLATGARHSYFGRDDWAPFAPGLKTVEDGIVIRRRLLLAFEEAEAAATEAQRQAWLTFVVIGGGPTGVELAGAIAELARYGLEQEFREIDPAAARVILVQAGPRLLPAFPEALSREAERALTHLGVDVQLDRRVEAVGAEAVTVSGDIIPARTVLWAAGVMASPAASWLGVAPDRAGRITVGKDLSVTGLHDVFAVGDTVLSLGWGGKPVPGLAPAAKQGGAYVARVIRTRLRQHAPPKPFRYRHLGSLATIGRQSAVADFGLIQVRGAFAWWLWGAAHIAFLVGGRNRVTVLVEWLWAYLTFRRGTRLITRG